MNSNVANNGNLSSNRTQTPPKLMVKQLYEKIEDLKIIEDIVATQQSDQPTSAHAKRVIKQLQQEILDLSQDMIGNYRTADTA